MTLPEEEHSFCSFIFLKIVPHLGLGTFLVDRLDTRNFSMPGAIFCWMFARRSWMLFGALSSPSEVAHLYYLLLATTFCAAAG